MLRLLPTLPGWELVLARTAPLTRRPAIPAKLRDRARVRSLVKPDVRRPTLAEAAIFVPAPGGSARLALEARSSGCAVAEPAGLAEQPELASAAVARLAEDEGLRATEAAKARELAVLADFDQPGRASRVGLREGNRSPAPVGTGPSRRRRSPGRSRLDHRRPPHAHELVARLLDRAAGARRPRRGEGLGAIAVTDHNVFGGALEVVELARRRELIVIPGEEVKTDNQGEVIGLFLEEEIPRGMTFAETIAAIREQGGLVYVPHPFDRMHAIPSAGDAAPPPRRHRRARGLQRAAPVRGVQRRGAPLRSASTACSQGAGSDAHVLQGVGTGALRMRRFDGPEEFLLSLRTAEVLRRPKSLAYLQSLKWVAQVKEKVR